MRGCGCGWRSRYACWGRIVEQAGRYCKIAEHERLAREARAFRALLALGPFRVDIVRESECVGDFVFLEPLRAIMGGHGKTLLDAVENSVAQQQAMAQEAAKAGEGKA